MTTLADSFGRRRVHPRTRGRSLALALAVALALLAAACSSSAKAGDSAGSKPQPAGQPIKLMVLSALTGHVTYPQTASGAKAAAKAINDAGGLKDPAGGANRPVVIDACDAPDPNSATACARRAVSEKYLALVGGVNLTGTSYFPIVESAGIPVVAEYPTSLPELTSPLSFPIVSPLVLGMAPVTVAKSLGASKLRIVIPDVPAATAQLPGLQAFAKAHGLDSDGNTLVSTTAVDMAPFAAKAASGNGAIYVALSGEQLAPFFNALAAQGVDFTKRVVVSAVLPANIGKLTNGVADGLYNTSFAIPITDKANPGILQYNAELDALGDKSTRRDDFGVQAWAGVHAIAKLLQTATKIDAATLVKALTAGGSTDSPALVPFDWSKVAVASGQLSKMRTFSAAVVVTRLKGGAFDAVSNGFVAYDQIFVPKQ